MEAPERGRCVAAAARTGVVPRAPPTLRAAQSRLTVLFPGINFIKQRVRTPHPASAHPAVPAAAALSVPVYRVHRQIKRTETAD